MNLSLFIPWAFPWLSVDNDVVEYLAPRALCLSMSLKRMVVPMSSRAAIRLVDEPPLNNTSADVSNPESTDINPLSQLSTSIPSSSSSSLSYADFADRHMALNQPCIITGLTTLWPASSNWVTSKTSNSTGESCENCENLPNMQFLKAQYPHNVVPV